MNAPPLPEHFGNYALQPGFTEVASPGTISWWPATPGWAVLAAGLALYLLYRGGRALRRWRRNRYRREARRELRQLVASAGPETLANAASDLLKRTALAAFPRPRVAGLHGAAWVDFLNRHCAGAPFDATLAEALSSQYRQVPLAAGQQRALLAACDTWIKHHHGPADA